MLHLIQISQTWSSIGKQENGIAVYMPCALTGKADRNERNCLFRTL